MALLILLLTGAALGAGLSIEHSPLRGAAAGLVVGLVFGLVAQLVAFVLTRRLGLRNSPVLVLVCVVPAVAAQIALLRPPAGGVVFEQSLGLPVPPGFVVSHYSMNRALNEVYFQVDAEGGAIDALADALGLSARVVTRFEDGAQRPDWWVSSDQPTVTFAKATDAPSTTRVKRLLWDSLSSSAFFVVRFTNEP